MKVIRYTIYGLLGLIALIIVAGAVFILTFDPKQYKSDIERLVKEHTGRTLILSDDIQMSIYPKLGVKLGPTTLTEKDQKTTFMSVESAQVSMALMPLLQRQILVDGAHLTGLVAHVARDKDGRYNFDDLKKSSVASDPNDTVEIRDEDGETRDITFNVDSVALDNATITYVDQTTNQRIDLKSINLSTGQIATEAEGALTFSAQIEAPSVPIDAKVKLEGQYVLDVPKQTLALSNLAFDLNGYAMQVQNLALSVKTSLQANLAQPRVDVQKLEINASAKDLFKASLRSAGLIWNEDAFTIQQFSADANVSQPRRKLGVQVQAPEVSGTADQVTVPKFTSTVLLDMPDTLSQAVKIPVQGNFEANLAKKTIQSTFEASLDDNKINVSINLPRLTPLAYRANIRVNQLDLDRYLSQKAAPASTSSSTPPKEVTKPAANKNPDSNVIDLSALNGLDLQAKISVGQLKIQGVALDQFETDISAAKGQLRVGPHSAQVNDGTIKGNLTINSRNNQLRVTESISKVSIGKLLKDLGQESRLEGQANVDLDLNSQGATVQQITQNLSGVGTLMVKDGAIRGVDIARLLRSIQGVIKTGKLPEFSDDDKTVFSELSASFHIKQGIATNNDLSMKAPIFRVQGEGEVNLITTNVNYLAKLAVVETTQGQGGPEIETLRGVTIPVRLTGPFEKLDYQIDIASLVTEIAKTRAGQEITEKVEKAIGPETTEKIEKLIGPEITDKLKGLFGR